jgi:hypothetical protein
MMAGLEILWDKHFSYLYFLIHFLVISIGLGGWFRAGWICCGLISSGLVCGVRGASRER